MIAVLIGDGRCIKSSFIFQEEEGPLKATANIALDGLDKYADTSTMKPIGKSLISRVSAAVRRRLLLVLFDAIILSTKNEDCEEIE